MLMRFLRRLHYWLDARRRAADLAEEMAFHRAMLARRSLGEGGSGGRAFGNTTLAAEDARAVWVWRWAEDAWQDGRYAVRSMLRQPAFAAIALAIVALATAAVTCVAGLFDGLVVRSLPVERADRLVWFRDPSFSYPILTQVQSNLPVFEGLFGWTIERAYVDWTGKGTQLVSTDLLEATPEIFPTLRIKLAIGRPFEAQDTTAAVISHQVWTRHFGAEPSAIGRTIRVGDRAFTIAGVTPAGFFGVAPGLAPDVILPVSGRHTAADLAATTSAWLHLMGRLKDGIGIEQADAALQAVWPAVMASTTNPGMPDERRAVYMARKTGLEPGRAGFSRVRNRFGEPLQLLMGLVTLLLAVACASVANLLLARGVARRREISVRLAIGARRTRVFRQLLTEALVLTSAGAAIGLLIGSWASALLVSVMTTTREHLALDTDPGWRMAAFTVALVGFISLVSALPPALKVTRGDLTGGLKETGRPGPLLLRHWSAGKILVAVQVALALVLLCGAAVFQRSLSHVLSQDPGVDADRILVVVPDATAAGHKGPALNAFNEQLLDRLRALPGAQSSSLSWMPPISSDMGNWTQRITIDGIALPPTDDRFVYFNAVSPRYFETVGMALRRGRDIVDSDTAGAPGVVVVNEALTRRFFPDRGALGHRISIGKGASRQDLEIVGIVQDAKYRTLQEPQRSIAYLATAQTQELRGDRNLVAEVRATDVTAIGTAVRTVVRDLDPRVPVRIETVAQRIRESTINERLIAALAGALGGAALLLACAGLYGLLACAVSRHAAEIGLRIALGARPVSVLWMFQRESLVLAGLGIAAGLAGALGLGRFVRAMLFQVTPADPLALAAAVAVMLLVASAAAFVPARRAASLDPVVALKRDS